MVFSLIRPYWVHTRVDGEVVTHCDDYPCNREHPMLTVVHGKLDAISCRLVEIAGQTGLKTNYVGAPASFSILSKDSFGNTRYVHRAHVQTGSLATSLLCV